MVQKYAQLSKINFDSPNISIHLGGTQTGSTAEAKFAKDRYCGRTLGFCGTSTTISATCTNMAGPVISKSKNVILSFVWSYFNYIISLAYTRPFVLRVVTDANDGDPITNEKQNRGFNLLFSQLPCHSFG